MATTVRFIDYPKQFKLMQKEIEEALYRCLSQGDLIMRQDMEEFETRFAELIGGKHCVALSNCTDALRLSMHAFDIGPGDEVITVSHTFVATIAAIHHSGATPVLVDVGDDHLLDVSELEKAITPRTKAIIPVHLNGRVCEMESIMALAKSHGLKVIEDAAQAIGGRFQDKLSGTFGDVSTYSFYPAKLLGAFGDAGAAIMDDADLAQRFKHLRDHGRSTKNDLAEWGFNCRMDNIQAAILNVKLGRIEGWIERRRNLAVLYDELLGDVTELTLPPAPEENSEHFDVFQNYVVEATERDGLASYLNEQGIETIVSWSKPNHLQKGLGLDRFHLPKTEAISRRVLSVPLFPELEDEQAQYVAEQIHIFYKEL